MANLRWANLAVGLSALLTLAAGCQSTSSKKAPIAQLPPPSFDGPRIVAKSPTASPLAVLPSGPRDWIPKAPARPWKWIVVHHSAGPSGSMAIFDREHKAKGWDGVGYHFVIGNGTNSGDGQVEVTPRWPVQKWGAHAKTLDNRYNEYGIGICLVGNFDIEKPTQKQLESLTRLVAYLMRTYNIPSTSVVGHRDTKPTDCPGKYVNVPWIRESAVRAIAAAGGKAPIGSAQTASVELRGEIGR